MAGILFEEKGIKTEGRRLKTFNYRVAIELSHSIPSRFRQFLAQLLKNLDRIRILIVSINSADNAVP